MLGAVGYGGIALTWQSARPLINPARGVAAASAASEREGGSGAVAAAGGTAAATLFSPSEFPYIPDGYGPTELANRARVRFPDFGTPLSNALEGKLSGLENEEERANIPGIEDPKSPAEVSEEAKCETCEKRKYQDGSDDPGVSFQMPTNVDPKAAAAAVRGHEMEHVVRERAKAAQEGRKVVSQSVTYHTGICPECGKFYVSGGTTRTVTAADQTEDFLKQAAKGKKSEFILLNPQKSLIYQHFSRVFYGILLPFPLFLPL